MGSVDGKGEDNVISLPLRDDKSSTNAAGLSSEVVGLIPAAGQAKRLQPLPCSKELLPVGYARDERTGLLKPKVAAQYLLEKFRAARIERAYIVIRDGKWDIPNYFRDGEGIGMRLAYIVISGSLGPPDTLDRAYPFVANSRIAFGFPDILFGPTDVYSRLLRRQEDTGADIVLGLYRVDNPQVWDMVETDRDGRVRSIAMKPQQSTLTLGWHCAVWTPGFSEFLHRFLRSDLTKSNLARLTDKANDPGGDLAVGIVLQAALRAGLPMYSVAFPDDACLDIGTPDNLVKAAKLFRAP